jgi:5'-methylthioadenosine/S-adenosylhomocysteine nucleosidase
MVRALIVTAIPVEFKAVLSSPSLSDLKKDYPGSRLGKLLGTSWEVLMVRSGKGNAAAASATQSALQYFDPDVAFFIGVAGGIKDTRLGDVAVADEVLYYEFVKVSGSAKNEKIQVRPSGFHCGSHLVKIAHDEAMTEEWLSRLGRFLDPENNPPGAFVGMIASGEKLVASRRSSLFKFLKDNYNQALAVEMEGYGFLQACYDKNVPGLVVRGISDLLSRKKKADAEGSQEVAARNATAFALQVLSQYAACEEDKKTIEIKSIGILTTSRLLHTLQLKKVIMNWVENFPKCEQNLFSDLSKHLPQSGFHVCDEWEKYKSDVKELDKAKKDLLTALQKAISDLFPDLELKFVEFYDFHPTRAYDYYPPRLEDYECCLPRLMFDHLLFELDIDDEMLRAAKTREEYYEIESSIMRIYDIWRWIEDRVKSLPIVEKDNSVIWGKDEDMELIRVPKNDLNRLLEGKNGFIKFFSEETDEINILKNNIYEKVKSLKQEREYIIKELKLSLCCESYSGDCRYLGSI